MRAGKLRHRLFVQEQTRTPDGQGGASVAWSTMSNGAIWGFVEPMSANEQMQYGQVWPNCNHVIEVRYFSGITSKRRILFGTRAFQISGVLNVGERNITQKVYCEESPVV